MRISLAKTKTFRMDDAAVHDMPRNLVVWWYGPIFKNNHAQTVPKVVIFFRELNEHGELGKFVQKETAMTQAAQTLGENSIQIATMQQQAIIGTDTLEKCQEILEQSASKVKEIEAQGAAQRKVDEQKREVLEKQLLSGA